ncbi:PHD finger protein 7-like [Gavia stellata]|uniref:PHD finger protein 7-like n=1 Tax=Gavia stellata TaxID=37040 RepID=UPI002896F880|nr:PHD finger protein 7-like [Gavia stellata]
MFAMKQQDPDSREQACMLCRRAEADPDICGCKTTKKGLCAHTYCLFLASGLFLQERRNGFLVEDTRRAIQEAAQKRCFVCGEMGATITCREKGCDCSFHLPCASEGECVTQFFGLYRSFCWKHRPKQAVQATPEQSSTCIICLDPVEDKKSYRTMVCPACQHAWFHRSCIQKQAIHAGVCFRCLHCQDKDLFVMEMLTMGIRVSKRQPSWESDQAFGLVYQRHILCSARKCLCPRGREQAEEEGSWQLLLCSSCAAEGIHRCCSYLWNGTTTWECDCCAGLGTASSDNSELASCSTASQAAAGLSHSSLVYESSRPSTITQAPLGPSHRSPVPESSSRSSHPGPDRIRHRSRLQRRAQKPYSRPGKHRGTSCVPAPSAEPRSPSTAEQVTEGLLLGTLALERSRSTSARQAASGLSCGALALKTSSRSSNPGPDRIRHRSRLHRQAQKPYSRPGKHRGTSCVPAPSAEPRSPSTAEQVTEGLLLGTLALERSRSTSARQVASGLSCGALALETSSRSSHLGPDRIRHHSRLKRRAQKPYSRPGRRC